jgi:DNA-binding transcriptional ArsR family regulator
MSRQPQRDGSVKAPMLTNQQLITAMSHPTRVHATAVLNERVACASEIGKEIGRSAKHVSYHLHKLEELGVIELVREDSTAGGRAMGKYYRGLVRLWYDAESWKLVDPTHQPGVTSTILALCSADLAAAFTSGTINQPDSHISRTPMVLDRTGYRELVDYLGEVLPNILEIQLRAANRMRKDDETVLTKVHIIQFESPDPEDEAAAGR